MLHSQIECPDARRGATLQRRTIPLVVQSCRGGRVQVVQTVAALRRMRLEYCRATAATKFPVRKRCDLRKARRVF
jgi:hypothetical protein